MPAARRSSLIASILAWCGCYARAIVPGKHTRFIAAQCSDVVKDRGASGGVLDLPRCSYDASLLFRRMATLQVDRDELASDDPLLFRELQGLCALCRDKERCVLESAQQHEGAENQSRRDYCPNATTLEALAAIQNCPRAAQYVRKPRSTGYLPNVSLR
jgi:hypothetical protein